MTRSRVRRSSRQGVEAPETGKPGEVAVGADHGQAVFEADGRERGITDQSGTQVKVDEEASEQSSMAWSRRWHPARGGAQPILDMAPRLAGTQRVAERAGPSR